MSKAEMSLEAEQRSQSHLDKLWVQMRPIFPENRGPGGRFCGQTMRRASIAIRELHKLYFFSPATQVSLTLIDMIFSGSVL